MRFHADQQICGRLSRQKILWRLRIEQAGITVNKNTIPGETASPFVTSGIRIGTPALTTRGMGEREMRTLGRCIAGVLKHHGDTAVLDEAKEQAAQLASAFPLFAG